MSVEFTLTRIKFSFTLPFIFLMKHLITVSQKTKVLHHSSVPQKIVFDSVLLAFVIAFHNKLHEIPYINQFEVRSSY